MACSSRDARHAAAVVYLLAPSSALRWLRGATIPMAFGQSHRLWLAAAAIVSVTFWAIAPRTRVRRCIAYVWPQYSVGRGRRVWRRISDRYTIIEAKKVSAGWRRGTGCAGWSGFAYVLFATGRSVAAAAAFLGARPVVSGTRGR